MAIDQIQGPATPDKMLQIHSMQKPTLSGSIFDVPRTEENSSTIHSGHFMVSRVHEEKDDDDDEEGPIFADDSKEFSTNMGYDFVQANKATSQTYNFGPKSTSTLSIDASLTKLFECMTLAYSGKITSPKWKPFRGMHLTVKDKVRLNNIIWREWHMQYIFMRRSVVCQFATPLSDYIHTKPEAVVLEGKYWKRRLDTVTKEYKKWRRYYRDRVLQTMPEAPSLFSPTREHLSEVELLERVKDVSAMPRNVQQSSTDLTLLNADLMDMDFTDNLFSSLNQPFAFPTPRELGQLTCADLIQPGLVQLQPNLEDFMDIDTMQEFLQVTKPPSVNSFPSSSHPGSLLPDLHAGIDMAQPQPPTQQNIMAQSVLGLLDPSIFNSGSGVNSTAGINMLTALAALTSCNNNSSNNTVGPAVHSSAPTQLNTSSLFSSETQMLIDDVSASKQTFPSTVHQEGFLGSTFSMEPQLKHASQSAPVLPVQTNLSPQETVNFAGLGLIQAQPAHPPAPSSAPAPAPAPSIRHVRSAPTAAVLQTGGARTPHSKTMKGQTGAKVNSRTLSPSHAVSPSRTASSQLTVPSAAKKDVFAVPQGKPVTTTPRKPRNIAPAPAPSPPRTTAPSTTTTPSMQSTYLAQLLTKGTYPGAIISVKKEPGPSAVVSLPTSNFTPILPAVPASSPSPQRLAPPVPTPIPATSTPNPTFTATPVSAAALSMGINKVTGVDFPTSVLLAAASSAFGTTSSTLKDALRFNPTNVAIATMASATEMSTSPAASPKPKSPVPMVMSPSPAPSVTPPPSSPLASVFSDSLSPVPSPSTINMSSFPSSPPSFSRDDGLGIRVGVHTEQRRVAHLSAEQKRRCNLKSGFDLLHTLVPSLAQNPKVSKATMLQKTAEHCRKMKLERTQMQHEAAILKQEIESLNSAIGVVQSQLPETGVPVTRQRVDQMKEMFEDYVKTRTLQNWKFWIFSIIIRNLFDSYNNMVSTANVEELCRTTAAWLDQHCSLVSLRPTVLNALRHLSMSTSILTEPQRVREQAKQAVTQGSEGKGNRPGSSTGRS